MRILIKVIPLAILLAVCSCGGPSRGLNDEIAAADSLSTINPDSALSILDKCGSDNEYTSYIKGKANLNLSNYPAAMESFLHAEKLAEASGNDSILALSRCGMMNLSDSICDINERAHYAVKACEVYEKYNNYDSIYAILYRFTGLFETLSPPTKYNDGLLYYASLLNDNDTVRAYFYADTLQRRSELLQINLTHLKGLDKTYWRPGKEIKNFNPQRLIDNILLDKGWKEEIANDSSEIPAQKAHLIATTLWEQSHINEAREFISYYRRHYSEKFINYTHDPISGEITAHIHNRHIDPRKEEFMTTFQNDVKDIVTRFQYEEVLMHEQTIRFQRILIIAISALVLATAVATGLYLRLTHTRRRQREEQSMQTAAELRTTLSSIEEQHLNTLSHLCNTYYENINPIAAKSKAARDALNAIHELGRSQSFISRLEAHLDACSDGAMSLLRSEMPELKESDYKLFLCNALRLSIPSICLLLDERREVIYNRRVRLRTKIQESHPPHTDTFLNHLR